MKLDLELSEKKLKALRVQLIETSDGVLLRRGRLQVTINGAHASEIVHTILSMALTGTTAEEILASFSGSDRPDIQKLINELEAKKILVPAESAPVEIETATDLLYWHFGQQTDAVVERLNRKKITIVGVNYISRQLVAALKASGWQNIEVVDYQLLGNLDFFDSQDRLTAHWHDQLVQPTQYDTWLSQIASNLPDCLVVTTDFGGLQLMRLWNQFCVKQGCHFLPVVLQDFIGYVGPLVVPSETACFECLRARQNSNLDNPVLQRTAESKAFEGQLVNGFHPVMASILGDIAALELTRFYGEWMSPRVVGTLIEVNLLRPQIQPRKVLKLPRCPVCSTLNQHSSVSLNKHSFMPGHAINR